jgi:hypothetical protein
MEMAKAGLAKPIISFMIALLNKLRELQLEDEKNKTKRGIKKYVYHFPSFNKTFLP